MENDQTGKDAMMVVAELDAVHERARLAYARRDARAYIDTLDPSLEYTQLDGRTVGVEQLARDVRVQLARMHRAETEFHREALETDQEVGRAIETLEQRATFQVRMFGFIAREWTVRRRGRYEWLRTTDGWKLRRVHVLSEEVLPPRTWIAFR